MYTSIQETKRNINRDFASENIGTVKWNLWVYICHGSMFNF